MIRDQIEKNHRLVQWSPYIVQLFQRSGYAIADCFCSNGLHKEEDKSDSDQEKP